MERSKVPQKVGELLGADYYVLPSSIHEVLVLPDNGEMDVKELESMVRDVNAAVVIPQERRTSFVMAAEPFISFSSKTWIL